MSLFKCEQCQKNIHDSSPRLVIGRVEVCVDCMPDIIIRWAKLHGTGGIQPFILKAIINECYDRKKRIPIPKKIRDNIFSVYSHKCTICGSDKKLEIDHIFPYSKGGTNDPSNLQVLCKPCNIKKSNKLS